MPRLIRAAGLAAAGLLMLLFGASIASAAVSINQRSIIAESSNSQLFVNRLDGGQVIVRCTLFRINANIGIGGATSAPVTIPVGNVTLSGCTFNGVAATVTQTLPWTGTITPLLSGGRITGVLLAVTIPQNIGPPRTGGVRITAPFCTLDISGTAGALATTTATTPPALVSVPSITFLAAGLNLLPLTVWEASAGCAPSINVLLGNRAGFTGTFTFRNSANVPTPVTGTLV